MDSSLLAVHRLHERAILPRRSTRLSAGFDLYAIDSVVLPPHTSALVDTGLRLILPCGFYAKIESRSGLCSKLMVYCGAGVIDADYTGEVKILLINHSNQEARIAYGNACAQLILIPTSYKQQVPTELATPEAYDREHAIRYPSNQRHDGGFGSTDYV